MLRSFALLAVIVSGPVSVGVVLALLGATTLAPIVVIVAGIGLFGFAMALGLRVHRRYEAAGQELEDVPPEQLLSDHPRILPVFPFLTTAGFSVVLVGLIWLTFVDWKLGLVAIVACFLLILLPGMRRRLAREHSAPSFGRTCDSPTDPTDTAVEPASEQSNHGAGSPTAESDQRGSPSTLASCRWRSTWTTRQRSPANAHS